MPVSKIFSATISGLEALPIEIETDISQGLPSFLIVGLPDKSVEESKERVRAALKNSGITFPSRRITVNLAPADIKKEGPAFDLPIAIAIVLAAGFLKELPLNSLFVGELALNGSLRPVSGILPIVIMAKKKKIKKIFLPEENVKEAALVPSLEIYPLKNLSQLISHLKKEKEISCYKGGSTSLKLRKAKSDDFDFDFAYIKGQEQAKRALEIAASGMHNVLMTGSPGGGKTLLARAIATIMPKMSEEEMFEVSKIYSVAGLLSQDIPLVVERPFRNPHHTSSNIALVGGGQKPKAGEITLSHQGVLFLDELPEFNRSVLEALRQPLEDRVITVSRAAGTLTFPAHFLLVGAMNPCPCGYLNDPKKQCICSASQIIHYQKKISGPLLDRIDIHLEVPPVKFEKLTDDNLAENSAAVRRRVEKARQIQAKRFSKEKYKTNTAMKLSQIKKICVLDEKSQDLLKTAVNNLGLSARAYHKILKTARTIADLEGVENILPAHIAEAIQYRPKEVVY